MKRIITVLICVAALMVSFSSCKKDNPNEKESSSPYFVCADNLSKALPSTIELKKSETNYSDHAFVPFDGKSKLKYDADNVRSLNVTLNPTGIAYGAGFEATKFGLAGYAYGFKAGSDSKAGDQATATVDYSYEGVTIHQVVTLKVVE